MRISLHNYQPDNLLRQRDGVNLAYSEIARMLSLIDKSHVEVRFHDFMRLVQDDAYAYKMLEDVDCVISNVGPHAHYYFYIREKLGLGFRIVRDVREVLRSNCLVQEFISAPYLRENDGIIFASVYVQQVFLKIFPHLANYPTIKCYPLMSAFPSIINNQRTEKLENKRHINLGYVGRLSEDKNFPQIVDLIIQLQKLFPDRYRLLAVGDIHSPSCDPVGLNNRIEHETGRKGVFIYVPPVNHDQVWEFYKRIDILLFLSTSNIESFGRVLIEAGTCGIPIIASEHAAAPELVPSENLVPVRYFYNKRFSTHFDFPMGEIEPSRIVEMIESKLVRPGNHHKLYANHADLFQTFIFEPLSLKDQTKFAPFGSLSKNIQGFIESIKLYDFPQVPDIQQANAMLKEMNLWFCELQNKESETYEQKMKELLEKSHYPNRTLKYIEKSKISKGDFTNVGGVDFELCNIINFFPNFELVGVNKHNL